MRDHRDGRQRGAEPDELRVPTHRGHHILGPLRVAFFTAGTLGAGHLVRGLAIGRALERANFRGTYRMFGPPQRLPAAAAAARTDWEDLAIVERELLDPALARTSAVRRALEAFAPDVLVVDMFWAPLANVLPIPDCEAWLLLRAMHPKWLVGPPGLPFDPSRYERILAIEPAVPAQIGAESIDPVVLVNPDETKPRGALRDRFAIARDTRLVAVVHAGIAGESASFTPSISEGESLLELDLHATDALFPVAAWLGDCDVLHAAAGYNTFWEAHWLGYAARTTFVPFARRNDDPHRRMQSLGHVMKANGADAVASMITGRATTLARRAPFRA
jgi:hypothetical protein